MALYLLATHAHAQQNNSRPAPLPPTHANVAYGDHPLQVIDVWEAEGDGPRPTLIYIHGGGWAGGDKKRNPSNVKPYLDKGIAYVSINYRLSGEHPLPAPVQDAARAIQFIRHHAPDWNLDPEKMAFTGGSAGACTSMWLLAHDDLANPESEDPIARQSTKPLAAAVGGGQTSIDPKVIEPWIGENVTKHRMIYMAVGETSIEDALANYETHRHLYVEYSPFNHMGAGDPPLWMQYGGDLTLPSKNEGHGIHHGVYGLKMKERAEAAGVEVHLVIPGHSTSEKYPTMESFLMDKLLQ